jgi:hypothetical protein
MSVQNYTERMSCSKETKDRILNDCKREYLKNHPEMRGIPLSQGFLLDKISRYYL